MSDTEKKRTLRCAIYTRKSSEEGLEQDFNSLHAQREACEAFIASQKHEGWSALAAPYDDGGLSGGTLERPALQRLLADISEGQIDVVVVYKIDRLTRSLLDFAKIVEIFDKRSVAFVSVTQQFSTTSSMGRLTLNVLLSFAQFEREVTGERIRDKIRASKAKGMFMGGYVPIGYDAVGRTLAIDEAEAATIRTIYALYLALQNVRLVEGELKRRGMVTSLYTSKSGRTTGGKSFSRGHLYAILSNPIYIGQIEHRGVRHPGLHAPIIDRDTFDAVQKQLAANGHEHRIRSSAKETSLLVGLIFRADGNPMTATHASKAGRRYRYYSSKSDMEAAGKRALRISAYEIEPVVIQQLTALLTDEHRLAAELGEHALEAGSLAQCLRMGRQLATDLDTAGSHDVRAIVLDIVSKVIVGEEIVRVEVKRSALLRRLGNTGSDATDDAPPIPIEAPISFARRGVEARLIVNGPSDGVAHRAPDSALVKAAARGYAWFEELTSGRATSIVEIAKREGVSDRFVSIVLNLAFLAPSAVEAIVEGRQPAALTAKTAMFGDEIPLKWAAAPS